MLFGLIILLGTLAMITKIAHFICPVVQQRIELELEYVQVSGHSDIHTGFGHCSQEIECGVAADQKGGIRTEFDWSVCPYVSRKLPLPEDTHID